MLQNGQHLEFKFSLAIAAALGPAQGGTTTKDGATYVYDSAGNRTSRTDNRTSTTLSYNYDDIYQLKTAKQGTTTKETYTYDAVGNRLSSLGVTPYSSTARCPAFPSRPCFS